MEQLTQALNEPLNQLIVLGINLIFYIICYSVRLAGGKRRTKKQKIKWSWNRFWNDLFFRLMMVYALCAGVVAVDMAQWLLPLLGISISGETAAIVSANLLITLPFIAGLNELVSGIKLLVKVWRLKENMGQLGIEEGDIDNDSANHAAIANDARKVLGEIVALYTQQDDNETETGAVIDEEASDKLAELGTMPYYKINVATPTDFYNGALGKGFNEGWGYQCVAGFKEFMYSLCGRYVTAGGSASMYASEPARSAVCNLGFEWHEGTAGLQDGDWGIWASGVHGHVSMYYQGKWFGQNQGAENPSYGTPFNLMSLPLEGLAGYFRPKIYIKGNEPEPAETKPTTPTKKTKVTYKYKKGDTFGQVIKNLGLNTSHGLWGPDGDVAYYTKQLGITGNIPVGTTLTFTPRQD